MLYVRNRIKRLIQLFNEFLALTIYKGKVIPVRFFSSKANVGDALNVYLISRISGRKTLEIKSGWLPHILGIGSIIHLGTSKSLVWGAGVIEEKQLPSVSTLKSMKFSAVRGKKTREVLGKRIGESVACPMGDPAVLMPLFYAPRPQKKHAIGIVPHYVDKEADGFRKLLSESKARLIDVELPVEEFLDELVECDLIISSSLHGLILADSYNIPNVWVKFSDKIIGGDFKFLDYYSTTDAKSPSPIELSKMEFDAFDLEAIVSQAKVAKFTEDKKLLLDAFPSRL